MRAFSAHGDMRGFNAGGNRENGDKRWGEMEEIEAKRKGSTDGNRRWQRAALTMNFMR